MSLHHILTVAKFEVKILFRSWFFRIYSGLLLVFLGFFHLVNAAVIGQTPNSWNFTALGVGIPYFSLTALNLSQGILAIFLASDFLKRDKKLDTTAVVYARPMSNSDYVIGKTLSILWVFTILQLVVLGFSLLFHLFVYDRQVMWSAYLFLPLTLALPSLVYILGLSFVLMRLLKNQAVTFLVLLSYIIITIWYLGDKYYNFFDYLGFQIPLGYSEFTSFTATADFLWQRAFYLVTGLGLIGLTAVLLDRLPENVWGPRISSAVTICIFAIAGFFGFKYLDLTQGKIENLENIAKLNDTWVNKAIPNITDYQLEVTHEGDILKASAKIFLQNKNTEALKSYILHLNSGLEISAIKDEKGNDLKWNREKHILEIIPTKDLASENTESLTIQYQGTVNDDLNRLKNIEREAFRIIHQKIPYQYTFLQSDYVLLPSSVAWYPKAGVGHSPAYPLKEVQQFAGFDLKVNTQMPNATILTQGKNSDTNHFSAEKLGGMSLIIGEYAKIGKEIDGMEYAIYTHKKHDFFSKSFDLLTDTLETEIGQYKKDFEANLGLQYPYDRFSLVEVPIHAVTYGTTEAEQVWVTEMAASYAMFDFKGFEKFRKGGGPGPGGRKKKDEEEQDPKDAQLELFKRSLNAVLKGMVGFDMGIGPEEDQKPTSLLSLFYDGVYYLDAPEYPYLNASLQQYLKEENQTDGSGRRRWGWWGMTSSEKANKKLETQSLDEILKDEDIDNVLKVYAINAQGKMMFHVLQKELGKVAFTKYLNSKLTTHQFKPLSAESLMDTLKDENLEISDFLRPSNTKIEMPAYMIQNVSQHKIEVDEYQRYQILMEVENPTNVDGLIQLKFEPRGKRRRRGVVNTEDESIIEYLKIPAKQRIKAGFVMNDQVGRLNVETFISKNIPSILLYNFQKVEKDKDMKPFEGVEILGKNKTDIAELIVDNEDEGFKTFSNEQKAGLLQEIINLEAKDEDKYKGLNAWNPPATWTETVLSGFYGDYIQSAYFIASGKGEQKVAWEAKVKEKGTYEVYVYQNLTAKSRGRRRGQDDVKMSDYNYTIFHDDGEEEIVLKNDDLAEGWNYLGTFYYSEGIAKVELSDKGSGVGAIIADACKWVKLEE